MSKKIKHNKIKNSGILFELLTRQLTADIIIGVEKSKAHELIEKYFSKDTELVKEYLLYNTILRYKTPDKDKAKDFISEVLKSKKSNIDEKKLNREKYNLVKEIKESYDEDGFFNNKINNYKLYASIYKLFKHNELEYKDSPGTITESKYNIIDNICNVTPANTDVESDEVLEEYKKQNQDLRLLAYKVMVDKFNNKYSTNLNENQSKLLKEYINNISSSKSLNNFMEKEIPIITDKLKKGILGIKSKAINIKVNEVCKQLDKINDNKIIEENHVYAVMNSYELIEKLKKIKNEEK